MAILENETQNYFKINFDSCSVRGLKVYVVIEVYKTLNDREKEKNRAVEVAEFGDKLQRHCVSLHEELLKRIEDLGKTPIDVLLPNSDEIDAILYPELRELQDLRNELRDFYLFFSSALYVYGDAEIKEYSLSETAQTAINELGFDEQWITDPIYLSMGAEVECGDYLGEEINYELFYNRLKTVMSQDISDC